MIVASVLFALAWAPVPDVETVILKHVAAVRFVRIHGPKIDQLIPGIQWGESGAKPAGGVRLRVAADPAANSLVAIGESSVVQEFVRTAPQFDVAPKSIRVALTLNRLHEGLTRSIEMVVENNETWTFSSDSIDVRFEGCIRIGDDGSLTVKAKIEGYFGKMAPTVRTLSGQRCSTAIHNPKRPEADFEWSLTPAILESESVAGR